MSRTLKSLEQPPKIPKLGSTVICDGELCMVISFAGPKPGSRSLMEVGTFEKATHIAFEGKLRLHKADIRDVRYDEELEMFYLWGRLLSFEQKAEIIRLRDQKKLPARVTRNPGNAPAAGEHVNLYKALYWEPGAINAAKIQDYEKRYAQPLTEGYARPDADDSDLTEPGFARERNAQASPKTTSIGGRK